MESLARRFVFVLSFLILPTLAAAIGQVGEPAAEFSLTNTVGEIIDVQYGQGEVTLLAFVGWS